ncbi:MAG: hypothetical protein GF400_06615 [Candidatus Eisenbacteria bacterium]|nr:hypothetical protein [Candidatus Eisenbacteria bacterium]
MRRRATALVVLGLAAIVAAAGCSSDGDDNPAGTNGSPSHAEGTVGAAGGTVEIDDEIALDIPAGALGGDTSFTIDENTSPTPPDPPNGFVSSAYTIEPSGTQFGADATVTIDYDPSAVGRADEGDVVICCDEGSETWTELTTTVDTQANQASAQVSHLSDYAAMVDTTSPSGEGIYAILIAQRSIMTLPPPADTLMRTDFLTARFDSSYAPCEPVNPVRADTVTCNEYGLVWEPQTSTHRYMQYSPTYFIDLGANYEFQVDETRDVPALTADINFPSQEPHLTDPTYMSNVSLSGFTMTWGGTGTGSDLYISIVPQGGGTVVAIETANDGSHTFSAGDLSELSPGVAAIVLNYMNEETIDAEGYDSQSTIRSLTTNGTNVVLVQ